MGQPEVRYDGLTIGEIRRLRDAEMTPKQKLALYGPGNTGTMKYRVIERDGKRLLVNREFAADQEIPPGWEDSPMAFGVETAPASAHVSDEGYDAVMGEVAVPDTEEPARKTARSK
jgi:hypothetical protein